ncbi:MAG: hypothetical protein WEC59_00505 [Salibacteraceae bacterium]
MIKQLMILMLVLVVASNRGVAQSHDNVEGRKVHAFSFKYFRSSFRHELGFTVGAHWFRSPQMETYYKLKQNAAYPEPVFNRGVGVLNISYEPRFRLLEFGSSVSFTLDVPLLVSISGIDVRTDDGFRYSTDSIDIEDFRTGIFAKERTERLGTFHAEAGAMIGLNFGQASTYENTNRLGLSIAVGVNYFTAPIFMNSSRGYEREDYENMLTWITPVSRLSLHFRSVSISHTIGVNPTRVTYPTLTSSRSALTNTYNRLSIAFRIGR